MATKANSAPDAEEERKLRIAKSLCVATGLMMTAVTMVVPTRAPMVLQIKKGDAAATAKAMGLMSTFAAVIELIVNPVLGKISDQYGRKPFLLLAPMVNAFLHSLVAALPSSLPMQFVDRMISGSMIFGFQAPAQAAMADLYADDSAKLAMMSANAGAYFGLGCTLGPFIGSKLGGAKSFFASALAFVGTFLYVNSVLDETLAEDNRIAFKLSDINPVAFLKLFKNKTLGMLTTTAALQSFGDYVNVYDINNLFMIKVLGYGQAQIGNFATIVGLTQIAGGKFTKELIKVTNLKFTTLFSNVMWIVGMAMMGTARNTRQAFMHVASHRRCKPSFQRWIGRPDGCLIPTRARCLRICWATSCALALGLTVSSCQQAFAWIGGVYANKSPFALRSDRQRHSRAASLVAEPETKGVVSESHTGDLHDPHAWLEEIDSPRVLSWVEAQNAKTLGEFGDPLNSPLLRRLIETEHTDIDGDPLRKLPQVTKIGDYYYDFWSDPLFPRGVWRRTTLEEYAKPDPNWEIVLSLDYLGKQEGESWVWRGYALLDEGPSVPKTRAMLQLSRGGSDAFVAREFDLETKRFVPPEEGGFVVPEARSTVCYRSRDVLLVATDRGPGSLTGAGFPRAVVVWRRGEDLSSAETIFEGSASDWTIFGYSVREREGNAFEIVQRVAGYYDAERRVSLDGGKSFTELRIPGDSELLTFGSQLLLRLGSAPFTPDGEGTKSFPVGSLIAADARAALAGEALCWNVLWEPSEDTGPEDDSMATGVGTPRFSTLQQVVATRSCLVLVVLSRVRSRVVVLRHVKDTTAAEGVWERVVRDHGEDADGSADDLASISVRPVDPLSSDAIWLGRASYTEPPVLFHIPDICAWAQSGGQLSPGSSDGAEAGEGRTSRKMKWLAPQFDASGMETVQFEAISADGTRVPYFVVRKAGSVVASEVAPTLVYAYGGFQLPILPTYKGTVGAAWLERGGVYVEANIRGGGEFGPEWSRVALKGGRLKSYEDLEAVVDDLVRRGIAAVGRIGLLGRSNGGLLVGNMLARPNPRFSALVGEVPLLDMRRYHLLLAGSIWLDEYGDPDDPEMWKKMRAVSPYHLVADWPSTRSEEAPHPHPPVLFTTSTRDDRVHPGHARKMVERLQSLPEQFCGDAFFFESAEGGHAGAADIKSRALLRTLEYEFLWRTLSRPDSEGQFQSR